MIWLLVGWLLLVAIVLLFNYGAHRNQGPRPEDGTPTACMLCPQQFPALLLDAHLAKVHGLEVGS